MEREESEAVHSLPAVTNLEEFSGRYGGRRFRPPADVLCEELAALPGPGSLIVQVYDINLVIGSVAGCSGATADSNGFWAHLSERCRVRPRPRLSERDETKRDVSCPWIDALGVRSGFSTDILTGYYRATRFCVGHLGSLDSVSA
jgi:hypothetical protein